MTRPASVLVIDDEPFFRSAAVSALEDAGYAVECVSGTQEARDRLEADEFDVVVADVWVGGGDTTDLLGWIRRRSPHTQVVVTAHCVSSATSLECLRGGAYRIVEKHLGPEHLASVVDLAAERAALRRQLAHLPRPPAPRASAASRLGVLPEHLSIGKA